MSTAIQPDRDASLLEQVLLKGDLAGLAPAERVAYYRRVCESLGLNPLTRPFDYIILNGKLTLYAKRDAADQLRKRDGISIQIVSREQVGDLYIVTARATTTTGRTDESIGAVNLAGLRGEALANATMKAETKAKRRVTLSIAGLGWLDESEAGSTPDAIPAKVDTETGEIGEPALPRLQAVMEKRGLTEAKVLLRARKLFGPTVTAVPQLTDEQIHRLADEIEVE